MDIRTPIRLLSTVQLPDAVSRLFHDRFETIEGELADAGRIRPNALLCSIAGPRLDAAAIDRLPPSLRVIATYSVGYDHIDIAAAKARGIVVFNTPGVLGDAVADAAMLLVLGAARRATESIALLRGGEWKGWSPLQLLGVELAGKTMGILGMGDIGQRIAMRARGFGLKIAYCNRRPSAEAADCRFVADPRALIAESDVVMLTWPSTPQTRRFINADTLALAKPSAILVNIGRGDLIDDGALIEALVEGRIFAAGLDVFDGEPAVDRRYFDLPNLFMLPHIGSSTVEARLAMGRILIAAIDRWAAGEQPPNQVG